MVFYANETEKQTALQVMQEVADTWKAPIVTKVVSLESFYPAEEYHTRYFENHPDQAYCQFVIQPKVSKLRKKFAHLLVAEG